MEWQAIFGMAIVVLLVYFLRSRASRKRKMEDKLISSVNYSRRITPPKSTPEKGNRRSKEQIAKDRAEHQRMLGDDFRKRAKVEQIKAERVGSTSYIWRSAGDSGCCESCAKNNGKTFQWKKPPRTGHPGEGRCCANGYCRCYAEVIIPRQR